MDRFIQGPDGFHVAGPKCNECGEVFDSAKCCVNDPPEAIAAARAEHEAWAREHGLIGSTVAVSGERSRSEGDEL
jgi:hypothetical protein